MIQDTVSCDPIVCSDNASDDIEACWTAANCHGLYQGSGLSADVDGRTGGVNLASSPLTNFGQGLALLARPAYPLPQGERYLRDGALRQNKGDLAGGLPLPLWERIENQHLSVAKC